MVLLPYAHTFLADPLNSNAIAFDLAAKQRVKAVLSILFQLVHSSGKQKNVDVILAHLNALLTEFNSAYFEHSKQETVSNPKLPKYVAFKLAVETHLTEQHHVHTITDELAMSTNSIHGIVKEFSGLPPKEWITNRLIQEAQRKLQYSTLSVKELAFDSGFNDPDYFSRLFKKRTGKSVSAFLADLNDSSGK